MEFSLSPDFTDRTLAKFFEHYRPGVVQLGAIQTRLVVSKDERFVLPFEHTVEHALYSGEFDGIFSKILKRNSCIEMSNISFDYTSEEKGRKDIKSKRKIAKEVVRDLFGVVFGLGRDFSTIDGFRNSDKKVVYIDSEQGSVFVNALTENLSINVVDRVRFSKSIWERYASGKRPRLYFG